MPTYDTTVTVVDGPTSAEIYIDGQQIILGLSAGDDGGLTGHGLITTDKNPIPYEYEAAGDAGFPADLKIVLTPIPAAPPVSYSQSYSIPEDLLLYVPNGEIDLTPGGGH